MRDGIDCTDQTGQDSVELSCWSLLAVADYCMYCTQVLPWAGALRTL